MTKQQRNWARQQPWFYCSDSSAIWVKDVEEQVHKFITIKALKQWLVEVKI